MLAFVASIPSPSSSSLHLGPLRVTAYGLMIGLGVAAAVWLAGRRAEVRQVASKDDIAAVGMWAVAGGLVGARLYHVVTDWDRFATDLGAIPAIWRGGLGIPGGLAGGVLVGLIAAHRRGIDVRVMLDIAAPAVALAQAIGRWGNWWNQELFGSPTSLPWALQIDDAHLPAGHASGTTFHPTFLYESVWSLALCGLLLLMDRHMSLRPGRLFVFYLGGYFLGRFWIEGLRIDPAPHVAGLRWNQWLSLAVMVGVVAFLVVDRARSASARRDVQVDLDDVVVGSQQSEVS
jgi:prolipoprotein diacylglyceryl transferase